jgi:hypothetical protein
VKRTWSLAGAFDAGHIRGWAPDWKQQLDFHQLEVSGHAAQLEADYRLFREEFGLETFRDGAWLARSYPAAGQFDWSHLDRLAAVSGGRVTLSLCHYEWPPWITEGEIWNGRVIQLMAEFAGAVAARYRGCFLAYVPVVEAGYWTAMMTDWGRWWPASGKKRAPPWWRMYSVVGRMMVEMAKAVRAVDPAARIALNEPWAWHPHVSLQDQGRPFATLLGRPDPTAARKTGIHEWGGRDDLLQIAGLNFYNNWGVDQGWPLSRLILEARAQFPDQELILGETGNCHFSHCFRTEDWLELIDEQVEAANREGAQLTTVTWAPILTLGDFDWGTPAPGAWVTWDPDDPGRCRTWDRETSRVVRRFTERHA